MKVLVLGAGRMGMRHCLGVLKVSLVKELIIVDINQASLDNVRTQLADKNPEIKITYLLTEDFLNSAGTLDVAIIAATAGNRLDTCKQLSKFNPNYFLVEKPLGQSLQQVEELISFFRQQKELKAFVNLNTRLYPAYRKLKSDLQSLPQFNGELTFSISTGTIGIGANGIHYIDLLKYLTDATDIKLVSAEVDETVIASGRGPQFADFGGFAVLDYFKANKKVARAHLILSSKSTVLGPWEIVGPHGRILIDEFEQTRFNKYRKADSELPVQRYAGDYLPMETERFEIPFLHDLTEEWLRALGNKKNILPEISDTIIVHRTMFDWLDHSKTHKNNFPVT